MDCCQLEENRGANVKRETGNNQDPENGSPDADPSGNFFFSKFPIETSELSVCRVVRWAISRCESPGPP